MEGSWNRDGNGKLKGMVKKEKKQGHQPMRRTESQKSIIRSRWVMNIMV